MDSFTLSLSLSLSFPQINLQTGQGVQLASFLILYFHIPCVASLKEVSEETEKEEERK